MEFGERKRRRKSQSYKLITDEDFEPTYLGNSSCSDTNGESKDAAVPDVWLGDESMEIKRQITGMMRLLNDKTGRVYQRVGAEVESLKKEPQHEHPNWTQQPATLSLPSEDHQNIWDSSEHPGPSPPYTPSPTLNGQDCDQYKALRIFNNSKGLITVNEEVVPSAAPEHSCCMCNCKGTLQAILQELRAMRRIMQTQKASLEKQEKAGSPCPPRLCPSPAPRRRPRKRRPIFKATLLTASSRSASVSSVPQSPTIASPLESGRTEERETERDLSTPGPISSGVSMLCAQNNPVTAADSDTPLSTSQLRQSHQSSESEVRLAEDYDVFIPKAQLDSILVNYTRSGSLLFRKLVCAFFDDPTLANSLPNGKRKRGLNDNRKGLDQNIVGAIKVFTEKYCTAHRIEKLPGPRDWVQILQDQIKLARRRLKRDAVDNEDAFSRPCTSCDYNKPGSVVDTAENVTG